MKYLKILAKRDMLSRTINMWMDIDSPKMASNSPRLCRQDDRSVSKMRYDISLEKNNDEIMTYIITMSHALSS